jgi:hypothetical protein
MISSFELRRSTKIGLTGTENYILTRDGVGYLRIVGGSSHWDVMTATADEDRGGISACPNRPSLCEAAMRLGIELKTNPYLRQDRYGREYIVICSLKPTLDEHQKDEAHVTNFCTRFFEIYDECQNGFDKNGWPREYRKHSQAA